MVVIDQLRITDDGNNLVLDAHVNKASYFNNVYIDKIAIDTQDTVLQTFSGPSENAIYSRDLVAKNEIYQITEEPIVLTEHNLYDNHRTEDGTGIKIETPVDENADTIINFGFRGEFTGNQLVLRVSGETSLETTEFLGTLIDAERNLWEFKGHINIGKSSYFLVHIYDVVDTHHTFVSIEDTLNIYPLNFIYHIYKEYSAETAKEIHLIINKNELLKTINLSENLLYVYIHASGYPSSDCPCRLDEEYTLGVTFDTGIIYNQMMSYTKELADDCSVPKGFINMILLFEALKSSIETENYVSANKFFTKLSKIATYQSSPKNCGCHG